MKTNKILTCDFDDTLQDSDGYILTRIINFVKQKHSEGFEIHIVSFREEKWKDEMVKFCAWQNIPVKSFVCTGMKNKIPFIQELGAELHIDDNVEVGILCEQAGIDFLLVNWGQENFNSTANLLRKI